MFSTVIFDLDGTLLNTIEDLGNAGNYALSTLSYPTYPIDRYKHFVGNGVKNLVYTILPEEHRDSATLHLALAIFSEYYEKHKMDTTAPYPGILNLLDNCKKESIQLAILSNKTDIFVREIVLDYFGPIFDSVWGLREGYSPKPDSTSLQDLLHELSADPASTLFCGDTNVDILTAKNAGITSCGVLWGFRDEPELAAAGADYIVKDVTELENLILR